MRTSGSLGEFLSLCLPPKALAFVGLPKTWLREFSYLFQSDSNRTGSTLDVSNPEFRSPELALLYQVRFQSALIDGKELEDRDLSALALISFANATGKRDSVP